MTTSIIGPATAANTTRVAPLPPQTATRATAREPNALANTTLLTQAYHRDNGASKLSAYKSYDEEGQPRLFFQDGTAAKAQQPQAGDTAAKERPQQVEDTAATQNEPVVCETCANRKYQDGSDDPGVSFQAPTHISPQASVAMVAKHEREHVVRETRDAEQNDQKAITNVRIFMDRCPECGKWYASGGLTKVTKISTGDKTEDTQESISEKDKGKEAHAS